MPFEDAASYPREAELSLLGYRSRLKQCFGLLHGKADRDLIEKETSIKSRREGEGYWWEIETSPLLIARMKERATEKLAQIDEQTLARFKAFDALADDTLGQVVEFNHAYDSDRKPIYEMWSQQTGKAIAVISGDDVKKYDTWSRFKEWF